MEFSNKIVISRDIYTQKKFDANFSSNNKPKISYGDFLRSHLPECSSTYMTSKLKAWVPCIEWIPKYKRKNLLPDLLAGFTVAIMNVPQAMAFGHLANLPPVIGLYTSCLPCLLYAFFGTCLHTSLGMFALTALMTSNVVMREMSAQNISEANLANMSLVERPDVQLVVTLTFMVGLVMVVMAVLQIHILASYLSDSLISGFITAAAIHTLYDIFSHITQTNLAVLILSGICVLLLYIGKNYLNPKVKKRLCSLPVPLELIVVVISTILSHFLKFNTRYDMAIVDHIPTGFPKPTTPTFSNFGFLISDSIIMALVVYVVSFSVGKSFGKNHKYKVDPCQELRAIALCQIIPSFFLCHPASVGLARSQVVAEAGSKSQVSNIVSALIILCVILWAGPLLEPLPMAVLSSIVVVALQGMIRQWREAILLWKCSKYDCFIWLFSFSITIVWDVSEGLIASFVFIIITVIMRFQWTKITVLDNIKNSEIYRDNTKYDTITRYDGILVTSFQSPLLFFNCDGFKENILRTISLHDFSLKYVILDASNITGIDKMGTSVLFELFDEIKNGYTAQFFIASASDGFREICEKCGIREKIQESNFFFPTVHDAVMYASSEQKSISSISNRSRLKMNIKF